MASLRALLLHHRRLAVLVLACALLMKALLPAGYMVGQRDRVLTVEICADATGAKVTRQIVIPHSGKGGEAGKSAEACPYAGAAMPALAGADALLLALALGFILALGFAPPQLLPSRQLPHLRPPLRGPPALV